MQFAAQCTRRSIESSVADQSTLDPWILPVIVARMLIDDESGDYDDFFVEFFAF